ncbi:MAG: GNAT family N-acetyltransferase [Firmicutes bacterium]|nr:GNAT family N-acetyltransferase [Bacillota bacterium]
MRITLQKARPEDAYDYAALHVACWQDAYKGIVPDEYLERMPREVEQRTERFMKDLVEQTDCFFYYAALDGKMIGRLIFNKSRDADKPDAGEISAIYLLAEYWDKGYGREMMDYALARLREMGYREAGLWVLEENHRARRFYERCGFVSDGTKKEITIGKPLIEIRYTFYMQE